MEVRQILWEDKCLLMTVGLLKDTALAKMKHYRAHALSEKAVVLTNLWRHRTCSLETVMIWVCHSNTSKFDHSYSASDNLQSHSFPQAAFMHIVIYLWQGTIIERYVNFVALNFTKLGNSTEINNFLHLLRTHTLSGGEAPC